MNDKGIVLRFGRIKSRKKLLDAFKHNKREFINPDSNINISKTVNNISIDGSYTSSKLMCDFDKYLLEYDIKSLRSNAVLAVEVLISISSHLKKDDLEKFFSDCAKWINSYFKVPAISIDVHLDESNPHLHAILLPTLVKGKLNGHKLIGNIMTIRLAQKSLYEAVGKKFGFSNWGSDKKNKKELVSEVLERLKEDAALNSVAWPAILKSIKNNPHHFLGVLS
jgi:hypothetical protein